MKKLPPVEKIFEALTAVADHRIKTDSDLKATSGQATMVSSDGTRTYNIAWENNEYASNDNGTYYQQYPGYPIIALLMEQGKLPVPEKLADSFKGVNWKQLNTEFRSDYRAAADHVIKERNLNSTDVYAQVQEIYSILGNLPVTVRRSSIPPVK